MYITINYRGKTRISRIRILDDLNGFKDVRITPSFITLREGNNPNIDSAEVQKEVYKKLKHEYEKVSQKKQETLDLISRIDSAIELQRPNKN